MRFPGADGVAGPRSTRMETRVRILTPEGLGQVLPGVAQKASRSWRAWCCAPRMAAAARAARRRRHARGARWTDGAARRRLWRRPGLRVSILPMVCMLPARCAARAEPDAAIPGAGRRHVAPEMPYYAPGRAAVLDAFYGRFLGAGELAFGIGAHVGDRSASFRRLGARVVAVEPQQPRLLRALRLLFRGVRGSPWSRPCSAPKPARPCCA